MPDACTQTDESWLDSESAPSPMMSGKTMEKAFRDVWSKCDDYQKQVSDLTSDLSEQEDINKERNDTIENNRRIRLKREAARHATILACFALFDGLYEWAIPNTLKRDKASLADIRDLVRENLGVNLFDPQKKDTLPCEPTVQGISNLMDELAKTKDEGNTISHPDLQAIGDINTAHHEFVKHFTSLSIDPVAKAFMQGLKWKIQASQGEEAAKEKEKRQARDRRLEYRPMFSPAQESQTDAPAQLLSSEGVRQQALLNDSTSVPRPATQSHWSGRGRDRSGGHGGRESGGRWRGGRNGSGGRGRTGRGSGGRGSKGRGSGGRGSGGRGSGGRWSGGRDGRGAQRSGQNRDQLSDVSRQIVFEDTNTNHPYCLAPPVSQYMYQHHHDNGSGSSYMYHAQLLQGNAAFYPHGHPDARYDGNFAYYRESQVVNSDHSGLNTSFHPTHGYVPDGQHYDTAFSNTRTEPGLL